ncbi:hypothetical protein SteCoe_30640 [Stentor coeruleus]|uniref:RGS domain-containing protein n=1 Tax=Stentor coeruleus TaxID=5963 RepID=A0A1R2B381_9CILI|nr:hypothetical protein SteCoe_30640 [Stentor coeruleus]
MTHWANLTELLLNLTILYSENICLPPTSTILYWTIQCFLEIAHAVMIICYIIRAYRLYFVLVVDSNRTDESSEFRKSPYRASQRWIVTTMTYIIVSLVVFYCIILTLIKIFPRKISLYEDGTYGKRNEVNYMIVNLVHFSLQLSLIVSIYYIRYVQNEFQMIGELILVTIIICVSPIFSISIYSNRSWLYADIFRNFILTLITTGFPIFLSFIHKESIDMLSLEMLTSVDLILQHKITLDAFEDFLSSFDREGSVFLEIYLSCECYFGFSDDKILDRIEAKITSSGIATSDDCVGFNSNNLNPLMNLQNYCYDVLENDYFLQFKDSKQYEKLRSYIFRQELLNNRVSETSMHRSGKMKSMISLLDFK